MQITRRLFLSLLLMLTSLTVFAEDKMDKALQAKALEAAQNGLKYLQENQAEDGSWSGSVGITALALRAFLENGEKFSESNDVFVKNSVEFILNHVNSDGSISETNHNRNYNTAVSITALKAANNKSYGPVIKDGQNFIKKLQLNSEGGYPKSHKYHGGIGYGGDERPDLSNQYLALEALKETDLDANDPVWERAMVFVSRAQNNSETNDQDWAGNDGGFAYMPGYSPHGKSKSYGSMTNAGLLSLLFAGTDKKDPRVQTAYKWITENYSVKNNPGSKDNQGLFYYYNVFAKAMAAYGETTVVDSKGVKHNWRNELVTQLLSMQDKDGSWVNPYSGRWWEGDRNLVTAWTVIALNQVLK